MPAKYWRPWKEGILTGACARQIAPCIQKAPKCILLFATNALDACKHTFKQYTKCLGYQKERITAAFRLASFLPCSIHPPHPYSSTYHHPWSRTRKGTVRRRCGSACGRAWRRTWLKRLEVDVLEVARVNEGGVGDKGVERGEGGRGMSRSK